MKSKIILVGMILMIVAFALTAFAQDDKDAKLKKVLEARKDKPVASQPFSAKTYKSNIPAVGTLQNLLDTVYSMPGDTVVAYVNDVPITKDMLMKDIWNSYAMTAMDELVDKNIILTNTKKAGIVVTEKEAGDELFNALASNGYVDAEQFFRSQKLSEEKLLSDVTVSTAMRKYGEQNFKINPADLAKYIKASHILIMFDGTIADETERDAAAKAKIDEIYAKVKAGGDFAELAKENSQDGSAANGGSLGWFDNTVPFVPEFKEAVFALKTPGEVSAPIKTNFGYHIIKLDALGSTATADELKELQAKEGSKLTNNMMRDWYNGIKNNASVQNFMILAPIEENTPPAPPQQAK